MDDVTRDQALGEAASYCRERPGMEYMDAATLISKLSFARSCPSVRRYFEQLGWRAETRSQDFVDSIFRMLDYDNARLAWSAVFADYDALTDLSGRKLRRDTRANIEKVWRAECRAAMYLGNPSKLSQRVVAALTGLTLQQISTARHILKHNDWYTPTTDLGRPNNHPDGSATARIAIPWVSVSRRWRDQWQHHYPPLTDEEISTIRSAMDSSRKAKLDGLVTDGVELHERAEALRQRLSTPSTPSKPDTNASIAPAPFPYSFGVVGSVSLSPEAVVGLSKEYPAEPKTYDEWLATRTPTQLEWQAHCESIEVLPFDPTREEGRWTND